MPKGKTGFLKRAVKAVKDAGVKGDTELAHVNPKEKAILKNLGGAGTRNEKTGFLQYFSNSSGDFSGLSDGPSGAGGVSDISDADSGVGYGYTAEDVAEAANAAVENALQGGSLAGLAGFGAEPSFGEDPGFNDPGPDNPNDPAYLDEAPVGVPISYGLPNLSGIKSQAQKGNVANALGLAAGWGMIAANPVGAIPALGVAALSALGAEPDRDQSPKGNDPTGISGGGTEDWNTQLTQETETNQSSDITPDNPTPETPQTPAPIQEQQNQITQAINQELTQYYDRYQPNSGPPRVAAYYDNELGMVKYRYA